MSRNIAHVIPFEELGRNDVSRVGGKNASLGEMVRALDSQGVKVPPGFATTADAYWGFVEANGLMATMASALADLKTGKEPLSEVGHTIRRAFLRGDWPAETANAIT
ncbi:MAG: PEP/pyruvate-binding domain-containing protein, partial [Hyphomicrobiaceae bacterium]